MFRQLSALSACALLLSACGGGGSSNSSQPSPTPPQPEPPFALAATAPADGATAVARNVKFSASFNSTVAPASVSDTSAKLVGPEGNPISVTVGVSGTDVSFTSPLGLPGNTTYRVEFAASIANAKGATLGTAVSRSFTTAAQSWQPTASAIGSLQYFTADTSPIIQADRDGNLTAVWQHSPSRIDTIFAAHMDAKTGTWSTPVKLAVADATGALGGLSMTTGAKGDVYVSWTEYLSGAQTARIQRYDPSSGNWSALPGITAPANSSFVTLVTDAAGNLTALVHGTGIYATRFDAPTGNWATPVRIDSPDDPATFVMDLTAVADCKGNLIVGWVQYSTDGRILVVTRNSGGSWSPLQRLDNSVLTGMFRSFSLSVNSSGSAAISWAHNYGMAQQPTLMASTCQSGSDTWSPAARLDQGSPVFGASYPWVVVDAAGVATTIWSQYEGLFASRYSPATGSWSAPQRLHDNSSAAAATVDAAGNVMVVQVQGQSSMQATQYLVADGQWHDSAVGQPAAGSANGIDPPAITIDAGGTVTVAWFAWNTVDGAAQYPVSVNRFK